MSDKKESLKREEILAKKYATSTACRLTTNAEFNADAEIAIAFKRMYIVITDRVKVYGAGFKNRRAKLSATVFEYAKAENERLKKKTWGVFKNAKDETPKEEGYYWVRFNGRKAERIKWDGEIFEISAELDDKDWLLEWSKIYK